MKKKYEINNSNINKLCSGFTLEKRFETDFELLGKIGVGGFASVYKVRNLLDNSLYAIKKIKVRPEKNIKDLLKTISSVRQEILYLANFRSEYVVNYNHSWVEVTLKTTSEENSFHEGINPKEHNSKWFNDGSNCLIKEQEYSGIEFVQNEGHYDGGDDSMKQSAVYSKNTSNESYELSYAANLDCTHFCNESNGNNNFLIISNNEYNLKDIDGITIFIQMELCKGTLQDYIDKTLKVSRRSSITKISIDQSLSHFEKILCGIEYIHSKDGLIHRDLKPTNIFFTFDGKIKIGDLGLATYALEYTSKMETPSPILSYESSELDDLAPLDDENYCMNSSFKLEEIGQSSGDCEKINQFDMIPEDKFDVHKAEHTSNIGTALYAAPEQLNGKFYDNKVDIYSLGIILLELTHPFSTKMEKREIFNNLIDNRMLPKLFIKDNPSLSELILSMTEHDPRKRPNIFQCKSKFTEILKREQSMNKLEHFDKIDSIEKEGEKRKRFLSEDIYSVKSYELLMKVQNDISGEYNQWKKIWIKIFKDKLLIFFNQFSQKASIIYDLNECDIKGSYVQDTNFYHSISQKKNPYSLLSLNSPLSNLSTDSSDSLRRYSSRVVNPIDFKKHGKEVKENFEESLAYLVEIEHPYLQKCLMKAECVLDSLEFYYELKSVAS